MLGVAIKTVKKLMRDGEYPGYRIGRDYRYKKEDIEKYLERQKEGGEP